MIGNLIRIRLNVSENNTRHKKKSEAEGDFHNFCNFYVLKSTKPKINLLYEAEHFTSVKQITIQTLVNTAYPSTFHKVSLRKPPPPILLTPVRGAISRLSSETVPLCREYSQHINSHISMAPISETTSTKLQLGCLVAHPD
jgi:hypothetical protein